MMNLPLIFGGLFAWTVGVLGCAISIGFGSCLFFTVVALMGLTSIIASVFYEKE
jgi:hypothetical protein